MKILRQLFLIHVRRPAWLWVALGLMTAFLGLGVMRVERRLDLMSLLPTDHPVVKASLEAGVGQQEILWLVARGTDADLDARRAWAEDMVEKLLSDGGTVGLGLPLNGMAGEGRLASPAPVPNAKGASLWPALLAAGSLVDGDDVVERMLTEHFYAFSPIFLGDHLKPLADEAWLKARLEKTAQASASPDPVKARLARLDPLGLRELIPEGDLAWARAQQSGKAFPLKLRTGYLESADKRDVLLPLVLDFPSGESKSTARVLTWIGRGSEGSLPHKASLKDVERALKPHGDRPFELQATGAHAIAYWETQRLTREVLLSLSLSFILIGLVYWVGFKTLSGYGYVLLPLLLGMFWALGLTGWMLGRLNLMAAAFGAVLLGIGDDVGILIFSRYRDERQQGRTKRAALRDALLGTGPGVIAANVATAAAFFACTIAPFPGFRDLGLTAGVGLLSCLLSSFLLLPALLMLLDRGQKGFSPQSSVKGEVKPLKRWKMLAAGAVVLLAAAGLPKLKWEEDLRKFRLSGNPALQLQESLSRSLGAGLQPLAIQLKLDEAERVQARWNGLARQLQKEGLPLPLWKDSDPELRRKLASKSWHQKMLTLADGAGLEPSNLERPLEALRLSMEDPLSAPKALAEVLAQPKAPLDKRRDQQAAWLEGKAISVPAEQRITVPLRLSEAAQDRLEKAIDTDGVRWVGTRPLFQAIKDVARSSLRIVVVVALSAVLVIVALFGRSFRFVLLALIPLLASQIGALGVLGWFNEPLTFLSIVAIPITLGVSVDTALNLLHRARHDPHAAAKVARVNAVCAGTTLAGFGGLAFSSYRGLQGLGIACLGGTALALIVTQWLLPMWVGKEKINKHDESVAKEKRLG